MKFIVEKNTVLLGLNTVCKAIRKSANPINENVEILAGEEVVTLVACNDTMRVEYHIPVSILGTDAEVERAGRVLVSASHFLNLAKKMPKGKLMFEVKPNGSLFMKGGKAELELNSTEGELLSYSSFSPVVSVYMTPTALYNALRVKYAASHEHIRPALTGVKVEVGPKGLTAVATDSHRLAVTHVTQLESEPITNSTSMIPFANDLGVAMTILPPDEDICVEASDNIISFSTDTVKLYMRLIEQSFPDISRILPKKQPVCKVSVSRKDLIDSLDRAAIMAPKKETDNQVNLKFENSEILLTSKSSDGSMTETLYAMGQGSIDLFFNVNYFLDALKSLQTEGVTIAFYGAVEPFVIESQGEKHLILPQRNLG